MNSPGTIQVTAPSRLHFGLFSFGDPRRRQYGGLGAMIDAPGLQATFARHDALEATGPLADRAKEFARCVARSWRWDHDPACKIHVLRAPAEHQGLGTGTQLGMAIAAGLHALFGQPVEPWELAKSVGRGRRSAIGLFGFARGGLLAEAGKCSDEEISPLLARVELPACWRFVLLRPQAPAGLSGDEEHKVFAELPAVPEQVSVELRRLAIEAVIPAAREARFDDFSDQLYDFGLLAGSCFAARQGGPFYSAKAERLVSAIRAAGVRGVGQSSWGPTLFALFADPSGACTFVSEFRDKPEFTDVQWTIAAPNNRGAAIEIVPSYETM